MYSKYRYLQREQKWKGLENNLDECIEEPLRTLDQMCFSSQFYFMYAIHVMGIMFMVFGLETMMNSEYNMFADVALVYLIQVLHTFGKGLTFHISMAIWLHIQALISLGYLLEKF